MRCNVGGADKTIRLAVGVGALLTGILAPIETAGKVVKLLGVDTCMKAGGG